MSIDLSFCLELLVAVPLAGLGVLSANLIILTWLRGARPPVIEPPAGTGVEPTVLVQLPLYNEGHLIERLLTAISALDWPRDRLLIQVLDDSTDGSLTHTRAAAAALAERGFRVQVAHRTNRAGFKAGALAEGLARCEAPFVAVFDADFLPPPHFLRRTVGILMVEPTLAFVQARWGHLNRGDNLLTEVQATMLDAHFAVEQEARHRSGLPLAFNGTCGVWRRAAIEDAGGWQGDTLTEDLDLSLRAHLAGWRARFLIEPAVPGELPTTAEAWRSQQFRWMKGYAQVARKLLGRVWEAPAPLGRKLMTTLQLCQCLAFPAAVICVAASLPLIALDAVVSPVVATLGLLAASLGISGTFAFLTAGQTALGRRSPRLAWILPMTLVFTSGLVLSNSRAVMEGLLARPSPFVRTPKRGASEPQERRRWRGWPELATAFALIAFVIIEQAWHSPFFSISIIGLMTIGVLRGRSDEEKPAALL